MLRHTVLIGLILSLNVYALDYATLPLSDLKKETQRSCSFVHIWAAWCSICIQEMGGLIRFLEQEKKVYPLIIDTSVKFTQEKFSKPWLKTLDPKFKVFRKPSVSDAALMQTLDIQWSKALPLSALYSFGKKKKQWEGFVSTEELHKAFQEYCPSR